MPIMLLDALWGGLYLVQVYHLNMASATFVTSMIFFGTIVGSPTAGWLSDRIGQRKLPMILGAIFSILTISIILFVPQLSYNQLLISFFALGFFTSTQIVAYPIITESNDPAYTGTAMAIASILIMGGAALAQIFVGWMLRLNWDGTMLKGVAIFGSQDFRTAFTPILIGFGIALLLVFFIRETYCRHYQDKQAK